MDRMSRTAKCNTIGNLNPKNHDINMKNSFKKTRQFNGIFLAKKITLYCRVFTAALRINLLPLFSVYKMLFKLGYNFTKTSLHHRDYFMTDVWWRTYYSHWQWFLLADVLMSIPDRFSTYSVRRHSRVYERTWKRRNKAHKWIQNRFVFNYVQITISM